MPRVSDEPLRGEARWPPQCGTAWTAWPGMAPDRMPGDMATAAWQRSGVVRRARAVLLQPGERMGHVNPRHKACFGGRARREPGCLGTNQRAACICGLGWPAAPAVARYGCGYGCVLHLAARSALERSPTAGCVQSLPRWRATWRPSAGCGRHG